MSQQQLSNPVDPFSLFLQTTLRVVIRSMWSKDEVRARVAATIQRISRTIAANQFAEIRNQPAMRDLVIAGTVAEWEEETRVVTEALINGIVLQEPTPITEDAGSDGDAEDSEPDAAAEPAGERPALRLVQPE